MRTADAIIAGTRCPIAGRISMDLMAIDITDLPAPLRRGQMVTLVGDGVTVDELALHFGTIGYEVLTSLGERYARVYKGGDAKAEPPPVTASTPPAIEPVPATAEPAAAPAQAPPPLPT